MTWLSYPSAFLVWYVFLISNFLAKISFIWDLIIASRRDDRIYDDNDSKTQWEEDFKLANETDGTKEYLDLSIQFGIYTINLSKINANLRVRNAIFIRVFFGPTFRVDQQFFPTPTGCSSANNA